MQQHHAVRPSTSRVVQALVVLLALVTGVVAGALPAPAAESTSGAGDEFLVGGFGDGGRAELSLQDLTGDGACVLTDPTAEYPSLDPCVGQPAGFKVGKVLAAADGGVVVAGVIERWRYRDSAWSELINGEWVQSRYGRDSQELFAARIGPDGAVDRSFGAGGVARRDVTDLGVRDALERQLDCRTMKSRGLYLSGSCKGGDNVVLRGAFLQPDGGVVVTGTTEGVCRDYPFTGQRPVRDEDGDSMDDPETGETLYETYESLIDCPTEQLIMTAAADGTVTRAVSDLYVADVESHHLDHKVHSGSPLYGSIAYDPAGWLVEASWGGLRRMDLQANYDDSLYEHATSAGCSWTCRDLHRAEDGTYSVLFPTQVGNAGSDDIYEVQRYLPDGRLDTSYGSDGVSVPYQGQGADELQNLVVDASGRATATGYAQHWTRDDNGEWHGQYGYLAVRWDADGHLDETFGDGGRVEVATPTPVGQAYWGASAVTPEGDVLIGGDLSDADWTVGELGLVRLEEAAGAPDPSFGSGGWVQASWPDDNGWSYAGFVAAGPDGDVVVGAFVDLPSNDRTFRLMKISGSRYCELAPMPGLGVAAGAGGADALAPDSGAAVVAASTAIQPLAAEAPVARPPATNGWQLDGAWQKLSDTRYQASGTIGLNGLALAGAGGSTATFTFDTESMALTAAGTVRVTAGPMEVAGHTVGPLTLYEGALDWSLASPELTQAVQGGAAVLGIAMHGDAVFRALSTCTAQVTLPTTLPGVLGGAPAALSVTVDVEEGLLPSGLRLAAEEAVLGGLVRVASPVLEYRAADGWQLQSGVVRVGGEDVPVEGWLRHDEEGRLAAGHLAVAALPVAGVTTLPDVVLDYTARTRTWMARVTGDGFGGSGRFVYDEHDVLELAEVDVAEVDLFGVATVEQFALDYSAAGGWAVDAAAAVAGGGDVGGALAIDASGTVTSGSLEASALRLGDALQLERFALDYSGGEDDRWAGKAKVVLPGVNEVTVDGDFVFAAGAFESGSVDVTASPALAVAPGIGLRRAGVSVATDPWLLEGRLSIEAGPSVGGVAAVVIDAEGRITLPGEDEPGVYEVEGDLSVVSMPLASARVAYTTTQRLDFSGELGGSGGWPIGPVTAKATLAGSSTPTTFSAAGHGELAFGALAADGDIGANENGAAGCARFNAKDAWSAGFTYRWGAAGPETFGAGCDLGAWQALGIARPVGVMQAAAVSSFGGHAVLAAPDVRGPDVRGPDLQRPDTRRPDVSVVEPDVTTLSDVVVPAGLPVLSLRFTGDGDSPLVAVTAPNGTVYEASTDGVHTGPDGETTHVVWQDQDAGVTYLLIGQPSAGTWSATTLPGSSAVTDRAVAHGLPAPVVAADVHGDGSERTLTWDLEPLDGQVVRFVEDGPGALQVLDEVDAATGSLPFVPAAGPAGTRTVFAEVLQDGLPRARVAVASFTVAAADPVDPVDEGEPTDEADPTDPVDPTQPTQPTEPAATGEPRQPTDPAAPADGADPGSGRPADSGSDSKSGTGGDATGRTGRDATVGTGEAEVPGPTGGSDVTQQDAVEDGPDGGDATPHASAPPDNAIAAPASGAGESGTTPALLRVAWAVLAVTALSGAAVWRLRRRLAGAGAQE